MIVQYIITNIKNVHVDLINIFLLGGHWKNKLFHKTAHFMNKFAIILFNRLFKYVSNNIPGVTFTITKLIRFAEKCIIKYLNVIQKCLNCILKTVFKSVLWFLSDACSNRQIDKNLKNYIFVSIFIISLFILKMIFWKINV